MTNAVLLGMMLLTAGGLPDEFHAVADAHRAVEARVAELDGYSVVSRSTRNYSDRVSTRLTLVHTRADSFLRESDHVGEGADGIRSSVDAFAPRYFFRLERSSPEPWRLHRYAMVENPELDSKSIGFPFEYRRPSSDGFRTGYHVNVNGFSSDRPVRLSQLIDDGDIRHAEQIPSESDDVDRFTFQRRSHGVRWTDVTLDVQASGDRLPLRLVESDGKTTVVTQVEYPEAGSPPAKVIERQHYSGPAGEADVTIETTFSPEVPDIERFKLSHYGFAEPAELRKPWRLPSFPVTLGVLGAILVVGGMLLRRFA